MTWVEFSIPKRVIKAVGGMNKNDPNLLPAFEIANDHTFQGKMASALLNYNDPQAMQGPSLYLENKYGIKPGTNNEADIAAGRAVIGVLEEKFMPLKKKVSGR